MWVCIPINNITDQTGGAGTRALSTSIVEAIIDYLPGVPLIKKQKNSLLVRRADSSSEGFTQFTYNTSSNAHHTHGDVQHSHFHVPAAHEDSDATKSFLDACLDGYSIGLISDSGCPAIADPGSSIIYEAHNLKIKVKPLVGASSIFLALMSSGMNGQNFSFNGYLPINHKERKKKNQVLGEKNS